MADIGVPGGRFAFDEDVWAQEVGRFRARGPAHGAASRARREVERSGSRVPVRPCESEETAQARLPGCGKVYVPLGAEPSAAPYGFVFVFEADASGRVVLRLLAYGERHPAPATRSVYERAHKRLHGRYPDQ